MSEVPKLVLEPEPARVPVDPKTRRALARWRKLRAEAKKEKAEADALAARLAAGETMEGIEAKKREDALRAQIAARAASREGTDKGREMKRQNRAAKLAKAKERKAARAAKEAIDDPKKAAFKAERLERLKKMREKQAAARAADPALEALRIEKARLALANATEARKAGFEKWRQTQAAKKVEARQAEDVAVAERRKKRLAKNAEARAAQAIKDAADTAAAKAAEAAHKAAEAAKPKIPFGARSGFVEKYGYKCPIGTPILAVELQAYRDGITPEQGGLGKEAHFIKAWNILWPDYEWNDWVAMLVSAFCNYKWVYVIGHRRASKTFTSAHIALLDYMANPFETLTSLTTVTFEGLRFRMWSNLLQAEETSKIRQPYRIRSTTNELRVFPEQSAGGPNEKMQIHGMAVQNTHDAAGKIKGGHAPRRRIFLDEAEDIADVIYDAAGNPMSAPDAKFVALANPVEKQSRFGNECAPKDGWGSVNHADQFWFTKNGGICLHFNGLQSPNVRQDKRIFTGLLTKADIEETRTRKGEDSIEFYSQILGWFPPDGLVAKIFPSQVIEKAKPSIIFDFATEPCATLDPAFESDDCAMHYGAKGKLRDGREAISGEASETLKFKIGEEFEPKDYQVAHWVMERCKARGIKPENFIMDRSGGGRGAFAILQKEWSREIHGIDFGGAATDRPLRADEDDKCSDIFEYFVSELWFRARACCEDGILGGLANLNPLTIDDLTSRRYETKKKTQGTVQVAEQKKEMKKRIGRSPDNGDAAVGFGELLIRAGHGPGRGVKKLTPGGRWGQARRRAIVANKRYAEANEYAH